MINVDSAKPRIDPWVVVDFVEINIGIGIIDLCLECRIRPLVAVVVRASVFQIVA